MITWELEQVTQQEVEAKTDELIGEATKQVMPESATKQVIKPVCGGDTPKAEDVLSKSQIEQFLGDREGDSTN